MSVHGVHTLDIRSEGDFHLKLALDLAMSRYGDGRVFDKPRTVSHWFTEDNVLYLCWSDGFLGIELPVPYGVEELLPMISGWLKKAEYPAAPDTDGDAHRGWRLMRGFRNMPDGIGAYHYVEFAVAPEWMVYGK